MGKKGKTPIQLDDEGMVDLGLGKSFRGSREKYPEMWDQLYGKANDEKWKKFDDTRDGWLNLYEALLVPIVSKWAEPVDVEHDDEHYDSNPPLRLDLGNGHKLYRAPWDPFLEEGPLVSEDTIEELNESELKYDAWFALEHIATLRSDRSDHSVINMNVAIQLGFFLGRLLVHNYRSRALQGAARKRDQKKGGKATGRATPEERLLIIKARDSLAKKKEWPKIKAAGQIGAQLRTGKFPGIDKTIDYTAKYVANLRAER